MKNLLTVLFALVLTGTTALAGNNQSGDEASGSADITTTVIQSLSVENNQDLEFGRVAQGVVETIEVTDASAVKFTIQGEKNEGVVVTFSCPTSLTRAGGSQTFPFKGSIMQNSNANPTSATKLSSGSSLNLNGSGKLYVYLGGEINVAKDQQRGNYSGEFTIDVEY